LMLLPNAAVAEIIGYQDPAAVESGPNWLLGLMSWRGISLPLISLEAIRGGSCRPAHQGHVRELYALADSHPAP